MTVLELWAFRIFKAVNPAGEVAQESFTRAFHREAEGKEEQRLTSPQASGRLSFFLLILLLLKLQLQHSLKIILVLFWFDQFNLM